VSQFKTILAPNAPWPDKHQVQKKSVSRNVKISFESANLDYFAETHNELLQPPKRGQGNPNAAKNFSKFNLRSL
jgi:hypothetical protein